MKNNILRLLMATVLFAGLSMAQGKRIDVMAQELGLNEGQKTQVQSILKEQHAAAQAARKNNATHDQMLAIREGTHNRLSGVMNPEQMQKFEARAKKARKHRKARG